MANSLQIEKVLSNRFEFSLNGGTAVSAIYPTLLTNGTKCDFKTSTGANIIKKQNIDVTEITIVDTFGGTGTFTGFNVITLWSKLTELDFWGETSGGGSGGVTTFTGLTDTPSYFGNNGKTLQINTSENKLEAVPFYNYKDLIELDDVSISSLTENKILGVTNVNGTNKVTLVDKPSSGTTYFSAVGQFDYNDLATHTTPLEYTTGDLQLTNDALGEYTFLSQPPYGVTTAWDEGTNTLDLSQLSIGDRVTLRIDLELTTTASNQTSLLKILFAEGTDDEYLQIISNELGFKTAGMHQIELDYTFDIRNNEWRNVPAKILFSSSDDASIVVNGWAIYIIRKSINILDVNDDNFKTLTVSKIQSPLTDESTNDMTVKVGYDGVSNNINAFLFGKDFSKYLDAYKDMIPTNRLALKMFNKTKEISIVSEITEMDYDATGNYMLATMVENTPYTNVSVDDKLEFAISILYLPPVSESGQETFTSTDNQTVFTLSKTYNNISVIVGRVVQIPTVDYTVSGTTVTMTEGVELDQTVTINGF